MIIAIGSDHAGPEYKKEIISFLKEKGHEVINCGTDSFDSTDYPIYAKKVATKIIKKEADLGILICGTGIGISISANKIKGIRAAVCSESKSAKLAREHNDANIIAFGARIVSLNTALEIVDAFINTKFTNDERHNRRIKLINDLENNKEIQ